MCFQFDNLVNVIIAVVAIVVLYLILKSLPTPPVGCGDDVYSEYDYVFSQN
jgi:hypothetical protein